MKLVIFSLIILVFFSGCSNLKQSKEIVDFNSIQKNFSESLIEKPDNNQKDLDQVSNQTFKISKELSKFTQAPFNKFGAGFGSSYSFPFIAKNNKDLIYVTSTDLVLLDNFSKNSNYLNIKEFDKEKFEGLQGSLKNSKYLLFFLTKNWEEDWFDLNQIQIAMDSGYTPVFAYWYFGDSLIEKLPNKKEEVKYYANSNKFSLFISKLNGTKLILMEPEFNKRLVLETSNSQISFAKIIGNSIDIFKKNLDNKTYFSLTMTDSGNRNINEKFQSCGFANCALGDMKSWAKTNLIFEILSDKIDFISFQEMVSQFSRNPENPGIFENPNLKTYTNREIGIEVLDKRILNFAEYFNEKYNKPIFLSYIGIGTGRFNDNNQNNVIDNGEFDANGFEKESNLFYKRLKKILNQKEEELPKNGLFGVIIMELFNNPRHDFGGYQYFNKNEYHLGIIKSSAKDEKDIGISGDFTPKLEILEFFG